MNDEQITREDHAELPLDSFVSQVSPIPLEQFVTLPLEKRVMHLQELADDANQAYQTAENISPSSWQKADEVREQGFHVKKALVDRLAPLTHQLLSGNIELNPFTHDIRKRLTVSQETARPHHRG